MLETRTDLDMIYGGPVQDRAYLTRLESKNKSGTWLPRLSASKLRLKLSTMQFMSHDPMIRTILSWTSSVVISSSCDYLSSNKMSTKVKAYELQSKYAFLPTGTGHIGSNMNMALGRRTTWRNNSSSWRPSCSVSVSRRSPAGQLRNSQKCAHTGLYDLIYL